MCDQHRLRSACAYTQSDQSLCLSLEFFIRVMLLTEHHLEFLSLKGGCTGSDESTLVKMTRWKSHVASQIKILMVSNRNFRSRVPAPLKKLAGLLYFLILRATIIYWNTFATFHKVFCARCGTNCIDYFLYSHEYRLTRNTVYCAILSDQIVVGCPLGVPISYYRYE